MLIGLAAVGAVITISRFLRVWLPAAVALLLYTISSTAPLIPAFHFWKWTTAAMALLAGTALAWLCSTAAAHPWAAVRQPDLFPTRRINVFAVSLTVAAVVWNWPAYLDRGDFSPERTQLTHNHVQAAEFLREATEPDDVVLGDSGAVLTIIGPAGPKTVAPDGYLANPYVPFSHEQAPATTCWPRSRPGTNKLTGTSRVNTT